MLVQWSTCHQRRGLVAAVGHLMQIQWGPFGAVGDLLVQRGTRWFSGGLVAAVGDLWVQWGTCRCTGAPIAGAIRDLLVPRGTCWCGRVPVGVVGNQVQFK